MNQIWIGRGPIGRAEIPSESVIHMQMFTMNLMENSSKFADVSTFFPCNPQYGLAQVCYSSALEIISRITF